MTKLELKLKCKPVDIEDCQGKDRCFQDEDTKEKCKYLGEKRMDIDTFANIPVSYYHPCNKGKEHIKSYLL